MVSHEKLVKTEKIGINKQKNCKLSRAMTAASVDRKSTSLEGEYQQCFSGTDFRSDPFEYFH